MILVTGAAGKTGLAVIKALSGGNERVRAMVIEQDVSPRTPLENVGTVGAPRDIADRLLGGFTSR